MSNRSGIRELVLALAVLGFLLSGTPAWSVEPVAGKVLYARAFELDEPYRPHPRSAATVSEGYLLVLQTTPETASVRAGGSSAVLVEGSPVERINTGHRSGVFIGIVAGEIDWSNARIWLDRPSTEDAFDPGWGARSRQEASAEGIRPIDRDELAKARAAGGKALRLPHKTALLRATAELILKFSPEDRHLAELLRQQPE